MSSDFRKINCGISKFRTRHDKQPFLRSLRYLPCLFKVTQLDIRFLGVNHVGLVNVRRVRRLLLKKETQRDGGNT